MKLFLIPIGTIIENVGVTTSGWCGYIRNGAIDFECHIFMVQGASIEQLESGIIKMVYVDEDNITHRHVFEVISYEVCATCDDVDVFEGICANYDDVDEIVLKMSIKQKM